MTRDKVTVVELVARKQEGTKICAVTAYDATFARLLDAAGVDVLLVGGFVGDGSAGAPQYLARNRRRNLLPLTSGSANRAACSHLRRSALYELPGFRRASDVSPLVAY